MAEYKGVHMTPRQAQFMRFIDVNESQAGAHFDKHDIAEILYAGEHPSKREKEEMKQFDKDMDESYRKNEPHHE